MEITTIVYGVLAICVILVLTTLVMEYQERKKAGLTQSDETPEVNPTPEKSSVVEEVKEEPKPTRKPRAKKEPKFNPKAVDRDKDGVIQEGTKFERPVEQRNEVPKKPTRRGRPKRANGKKETKAGNSKK